MSKFVIKENPFNDNWYVIDLEPDDDRDGVYATTRDKAYAERICGLLNSDGSTSGDVTPTHDDGYRKGLEVARKIANWLFGQDRAAALKEIARAEERAA